MGVVLWRVATGGTEGSTDEAIQSNTRVKRVIDSEAEVVCYTYRVGYRAGGISCIPMSFLTENARTNLAEGAEK